MSNTDKLTVLAEAIIAKIQTGHASIVTLTANADGSHPTLQAADVYYGDQDKIPRVPSVCVEPSSKNRTLQANQYVMQNEMLVHILLYHSADEVQRARKQADELGEAIESLLHSDPQMSGTLVYGFCPTFESGYKYRGTTLYRSVLITYNGTTKQRPS